MTNNDELALKLKSAAEKALPAIEKYEADEIDGDDALEMLSDFTDVIKPANILALLAERDADKKRIDKLSTERAKGVETLQGDLIQARIRADAAEKQVAELESRTVSLTIKTPTIGRAYSALAHVWTVQEVREACAAAGIKLEVGELVCAISR